MYSLFIDTLSSPAFICLFDNERDIKDNFSWQGKHAEFDTLIESINTLLAKNSLEYSDLAGIVCIIGPGGFTGIRVTTLVANTLGYSFGIPLYPATVNDFFREQESPTPWILPLTKTEVLLWEDPNQLSPTIVKSDALNIPKAYSSNQTLSPLGGNISYIQANDYKLFLQNFVFPEKVSLLQPKYARDPNILIKK